MARDNCDCVQIELQRDANIREKVRETHWKVIRVTPTTRRQNISRIPPIAASADAIGMIVSGPIYICALLHERLYRQCTSYDEAEYPACEIRTTPETERRQRF